MAEKIKLIEVPEKEYDALVALHTEVMRRTALPLPDAWSMLTKVTVLTLDLGDIKDKSDDVRVIRSKCRDEFGAILPRYKE